MDEASRAPGEALGQGPKSTLEKPSKNQLGKAILWIPARLVQHTSTEIAVSVGIDFIPRYLLEHKYLVGWVDANNRIWKQDFTVLKRHKKNVVYLLATGPGGKTLLELYRQGIRRIFVAALRPAP